MTNYEKYMDVIDNYREGKMKVAVHNIYNKPVSCINSNCSDCLFNNNIECCYNELFNVWCEEEATESIAERIKNCNPCELDNYLTQLFENGYKIRTLCNNSIDGFPIVAVEINGNMIDVSSYKLIEYKPKTSATEIIEDGIILSDVYEQIFKDYNE